MGSMETVLQNMAGCLNWESLSKLTQTSRQAQRVNRGSISQAGSQPAAAIPGSLMQISKCAGNLELAVT